MALVYTNGGHAFTVAETAKQVLDITGAGRPPADPFMFDGDGAALTFTDGRKCVVRRRAIVAVHDTKDDHGR
jgi:hypothetical protein